MNFNAACMRHTGGNLSTWTGHLVRSSWMAPGRAAVQTPGSTFYDVDGPSCREPGRAPGRAGGPAARQGASGHPQLVVAAGRAARADCAGSWLAGGYRLQARPGPAAGWQPPRLACPVGQPRASARCGRGDAPCTCFPQLTGSLRAPPQGRATGPAVRLVSLGSWCCSGPRPRAQAKQNSNFSFKDTDTERVPGAPCSAGALALFL